MTKTESNFNELVFFAQVKKRPGMFLGVPSLISLRDHVFGMEYAFSFCGQANVLKYFRLFIEWYQEEIIKDLNGYACWWNHILYQCGNDDRLAFESFIMQYEQYLREVHSLYLPEVE